MKGARPLGLPSLVPHPSCLAHQAATVALGLQGVVCGHKDGVGSGGFDPGNQLVVLGTGGRDGQHHPQS